MEELAMNQVEMVSGGLPDTGSQAVMILGGFEVGFCVGLINGFMRAF